MGDIYSVLNNHCNSVKDIADCILSFLSYTESTLGHIGDKSKESYGCSSNPKNNRNGEQPYGTEMVILIAPPKQTKLPSKQYILSSLRIWIKYPSNYIGYHHGNCTIFIGIQEFSTKYPQSLGSGNVIYGKVQDIEDDDEELQIEPKISLKCGKYYSFWITCIKGEFNCPLKNLPWEKQHNEHQKIRKNLHLTMGDVMYYCCNPTMNEYQIRHECYKFYEVSFTTK